MATISQMARQAGLRPSALRYYESVGLLPRPARVGGRRLYDNDALRRLTVIRLARCAGFSLAEMRELIKGPHGAATSVRWQQLAERKLRDVELVLRQARAMRRILLRGIRCHCDTLDECVFCAFGTSNELRRRGALPKAPPTLREFLRRHTTA